MVPRDRDEMFDAVTGVRQRRQPCRSVAVVLAAIGFEDGVADELVEQMMTKVQFVVTGSARCRLPHHDVPLLESGERIDITTEGRDSVRPEHMPDDCGALGSSPLHGCERIESRLQDTDERQWYGDRRSGEDGHHERRR